MTAPLPTGQAPAAPPNTFLGRLDAWMAANPWHPRATPFFFYIISILVISLITDGSFGLPELTVIKPLLYTVQVGVVGFLLWRYRKLLPELNLKFHWLAVPTGVGLLFAWVYLGYATNLASHNVRGIPILGDAAAWLIPTHTADPLSKTDKNWMYENRGKFGEAWYWTAMSLRLVGMSLVVPLFEELWVRSAVLRSAFHPGKTKTAILQLAVDLPIIGESVSQTQAAKQAVNEPPMFTRQLQETPVGKLTAFAVIASTLIFMLSHTQRDYLGCIACGLIWCWMVWYTNKPKKGETWNDQPPGGRYGLGPIVWSHGITNATLWAWTIYTNDWQFL